MPRFRGSDSPEQLLQGKLPSFEPEKQFRVLPFDYQSEDRLNDWFEQTLLYCILRKRFDRSEADRAVLHLFRLLCIKFRADHPTRGEPFRIKPELAAALEYKVCNAVIEFVDRVRADWRRKPRPAQSKSVERQQALMV